MHERSDFPVRHVARPVITRQAHRTTRERDDPEPEEFPDRGITARKVHVPDTPVLQFGRGPLETRPSASGYSR